MLSYPTIYTLTDPDGTPYSKDDDPLYDQKAPDWTLYDRKRSYDNEDYDDDLDDDEYDYDDIDDDDFDYYSDRRRKRRRRANSDAFAIGMGIGAITGLTGNDDCGCDCDS